jgi:ribosome biogenesis GTPase
VGKSTLLNALFGLELETGEISRKIQRGKNTTRHAELLMQDGMRVLDTAGFSLLELDGKMEPITLKEYYPEFAEHEGGCRFEPCFHDREPGCSVTAAVNEGKIHPQRVARYRALLAEVKQAWRERYD